MTISINEFSKLLHNTNKSIGYLAKHTGIDEREIFEIAVAETRFQELKKSEQEKLLTVLEKNQCKHPNANPRRKASAIANNN